MYRIIISYDGTNYHGWQSQEGLPTVAQTMQDSFMAVFGFPIQLYAASRTDAGVHARAQVATFKSALNIDLASMKFAWNNRLPQDIHIRSIKVVGDDYSPHANIIYKKYRYYLFTQRPSPYMARYGWHISSLCTLEKLQEALTIFVGTHDFRAFSKGDERGDDTIRTIDSIEIVKLTKIPGYKITVKGPKFLRHMIRRIVGATVAYALRGTITTDYLHSILMQKTTCPMLPTAPAHGLVLYKIRYTLNPKIVTPHRGIPND